MGQVGRFAAVDAVRYPRRSRVIVRTRRGLELGEVLMSPQHSLLNNILGIFQRAEQPIAVGTEFTAIRFDQGRELLRITFEGGCEIRKFGLARHLHNANLTTRKSTLVSVTRNADAW